MRRNVSFSSSSSNSAALGIPDEEKEREEEEEKIGISFPPFPPPETGEKKFRLSPSQRSTLALPQTGEIERNLFFYSQPLFFLEPPPFPLPGRKGT